ALVMTLGVYTRLLTVFPLAWVGIFVLGRDRRAGLRLAVYVIGACAVVLAALSFTSDGWYFTYTVTLLQKHEVHPSRVVVGIRRIIEFLPWSPAVLVAAGGLAARKRLSPESALWAGVFAASIPAALLPFAKDGGHDNDYMPIGLFVGAAAALVALDVAA